MSEQMRAVAPRSIEGFGGGRVRAWPPCAAAGAAAAVAGRAGAFAACAASGRSSTRAGGRAVRDQGAQRLARVLRTGLPHQRHEEERGGQADRRGAAERVHLLILQRPRLAFGGRLLLHPRAIHGQRERGRRAEAVGEDQVGGREPLAGLDVVARLAVRLVEVGEGARAGLRGGSRACRRWPRAPACRASARAGRPRR